MKKLLTAICLVSIVLFAGIASAATATGAFDVMANVSATCSVNSASNLNFGSYVGDQLDGTSTLSVTCTTGTAVTSITLSLGQYASGSDRRMNHTSYYLTYGLYSDAGRTTVWDMVTTPTPPSMDGTAKSITVYGRIPSGQTGAGVGSYTDTITVTINY